MSAENVLLDFVVRRTSREIAAQTHTLAMARQRGLERIATIVPGKTTIRGVRGRIYYTATGKRTAPPDARWWIDIGTEDYKILQRVLISRAGDDLS